MNKATVFAGFITGIVIGVTAGFMLSKKKHEMFAQAEIDSVKQRFAERKPVTNNKDISPVENDANSIKQQSSIIKEYSDCDEDEAEYYDNDYDGG